MQTEHWFRSPVREMTPRECWELLAGQRVGRIGLVDDRGPVVFPVNFARDGQTVLIATTADGTIAQHTRDARVVFEVDGIDEYTESGWSVIVRGDAREVAAPDLSSDMVELPAPWAEGARTCLFQITPTEVTGRRLLPT